MGRHGLGMHDSLALGSAKITTTMQNHSGFSLLCIPFTSLLVAPVMAIIIRRLDAMAWIRATVTFCFLIEGNYGCYR